MTILTLNTYSYHTIPVLTAEATFRIFSLIYSSSIQHYLYEFVMFVLCVHP